MSTAPAITAREVRASPAQELRWRSSTYSLANRIYRLSGPLDVSALEGAFASLIDRHEALRASLHSRDGELVMRVHLHVQAPLAFVDVRDRPAARREEAVQRYLGDELRRPFDREVAPLLRATLIRVGTDEHVLLVIVDHVVSDGWSMDVVARDLSSSYRAALGEALEPSPPPIQYPDLAERQWEQLTEERLAALASFYARLFPKGPADMGVWLPGYDARPSSTDGEQFRGLTLQAPVGHETTAGLRRVARTLRVTLFVLTGTVFVRQLQEESGRERVTLSTSFAGRAGPGADSVIGYLARSLWVPTTLSGTRDLGLDARSFHRDVLGVIRSADVPPRVAFDRIWSTSALAEMDSIPRVDFLCTPFWGGSLELPGIRVEPVDVDEGLADAALALYLTDRGSHLDAQLIFPPARLREAYARSVFEDYLARLRAISAG